MYKLIATLITLAIFFINSSPVSARANSFVSVVNPLRGGDFWNNKNQTPSKTVEEQLKTINQSNIQPTWLLRYDVLNDPEIIYKLKNLPEHEKGLFLEVTPSWTNQAGVSYHQSESWHFAGSALLTGYERAEREQLIDKAFEKFKETFGYYPTSVGAWWIDGYSLEYMVKKYGITAALVVSDQYSTDNYQIWGQFWSTPYYPSKRNALEPARNMEDKLPLVMMQWAARDPVNAYGNGVGESTYSVQANDYLDYHNLNTDYFSRLLDVYTNQRLNQFGHIVVGLENSYDWAKYGEEYKKQIQVLVDKKNKGQFSIVPMKDFADWYIRNFPQFSPEHVIEASDPLGTGKKAVWFMNLNYRAGWFFNQDGSVIRDIHQYTGGEEICFVKRCDEVNFATTATRVLDEVSFGHKWVIDEGKITDFKVEKHGNNYVLSYINEAGKMREIELLEKDIGVDGKTSSIDGVILNATEQSITKNNQTVQLKEGFFKWSLKSVTFKIIKFLLFLIFGCLIPGYLVINKILKNAQFLQKVFLSIILGFVLLTLVFYVLSLLQIRQLIYAYLVINIIIFITIITVINPIRQFYHNLLISLRLKLNLLILIVILAGIIFQVIPTFKNALHFPYGLGFWGPNTHDGVWHISLINQLIKGVPPQNPILGGEVLKNYHYFYDLLIAATIFITNIPTSDLIFRFYPILFSLLLGMGSYYLITVLFGNMERRSVKLGTFFALYLIYFSGSFGWMVDLIKGKGMGGESNFWANQSISFNLNPPFAISILIIIAIFQILFKMDKLNRWNLVVVTILSGSLVAFKAYAAVLILGSLLIMGIVKKSLNFLLIFLTSLSISTLLFLSNFSIGGKLMIFSPFWFIHSMIDSTDRVGWTRLSLAREVGFSERNWFKFIAAEGISLFLFIFGNLGTRFFALFSLFKLRTIFSNNNYLFVLIFSLSALIIPILFIQAGNPWNTIQFIYYFLYVSAVISGIFLSKFLSRAGLLLGLPFVIFIGIITPINSWATANGYLSYRPHALITNKEYDGLKFLSQQGDGVVLTFPYDKRLKDKLAEPWPLFAYDSTSYVGAFSNKATFIEDESQNQILLTDYKKRLVASKDFFAKSGIGEEEFLTKNHIKYIYIPKISKVKLNDQIKNIKIIFENDEVLVYEVGDK